MKSVIKEYASMVIALISTCLFIAIFGNLIFHQDGMLAQMIWLVLEGGV